MKTPVLGIIGMIGVPATGMALRSTNVAVYLANFPVLVIVFSLWVS